jgi:regulator of protease activity HflC (stomatin/prohibitin superfamily)
LHDTRSVAKSPKPEIFPGLAFFVFGVALAGFALSRWSLSVPLRFPFFALAGSLFIAAGGFLSVAFTGLARLRGALEGKARKGSRRFIRVPKSVQRELDRAIALLAKIDWRADWLPLLTSLALTAAAGACLWEAWLFPIATRPSLQFDEWMGGGLVVMAFPLLVLERRFAGLSESVVLAAPALARLIRLLLLELIGLALVYLLYWLGLAWAAPVAQALLLFAALTTCELLLRDCAYFFMPLPALESRSGHADSLLLRLLRLQRPSFEGMSAAISRQFGIDLARSWALDFVRRASFPALIGLGIFAWLLSGVSALDISQRAIYEAFGRPQTVFHSGLHVYLPWPLGRLRPVEYGVVREIPIVFASEDGTPPEVETTSARDETIEGPPPESADRLWDASHPSEASYLVASNRNGRENFEIVNIDLRILYRIGLSDAAAHQAVYGVEAPDALIRAAAGRMLARYFARYTMTDVLGQNRELFIRGFQTELQSRLDVLSSGVEILGVVIEAIHPPPAAATAYQDVQASQIRSEILVASARADAVTTMGLAQQNATTLKDAAQAAAEELVDQAKVDTAIFAGDVTAYRQDGAAFLFERRLNSVRNALQTKIPLTIVDSRITANQMPTLDYRAFGAMPFVPPAPAAAEDEEQ